MYYVRYKIYSVLILIYGFFWPSTQNRKTVFLVLPSWDHPRWPFQPVECFSVGPVSHSSLWVTFTRDGESHDRPAGISSPPLETHTNTNPLWSHHWSASLSVHWEGFELCVCVFGMLLGFPVWPVLVLPGRVLLAS